MAYNYLQDMPKQGSMDSFIDGYDIGLQRKKNQAIDNDNKALTDILRGDTNAITRLQSPELIQKAQNHLRELEQRKALQGFYTPATKDQYQANVTQNPIAAIMDGGKKPSNLVQSQQPSFQESQAPTMLDMLQTGKIASGKPASYDIEGAGNYLLGQANFDQLGKLTDYRKAIAKDEAEWGTNPTKGINPSTGLADSYITDRKGNIKWLGSGVYEAPKDPKVTPLMRNGQPVTVGVPNTNEVKILMSDGTLMSGGSIPKPELVKPDPVASALTLFEKKEEIKAQNELKKSYREKFANALDAMPLIDNYITALKNSPKSGFKRDVQSKLGYFGSGDEKQQAAMATAEQAGESLLTFAVKQPGPSTDRDVMSYRAQMGVIQDPNASTASKIAAAEQAKIYVNNIHTKYGAYLGDILSGKINPEDIAAQKVSNDPYAITKDTDPRRARYLMNHKKLVDSGDIEGANMLTEMYKKGAK